MRLNTKRALITGGARGIGYAIAETFCREGSVVYIADVNKDLGSSAAAKRAAEDREFRGDGQHPLS